MFHLLDYGVIYHVINHNILFSHNWQLKVQLKINHQIIVHIDFDDEDDEVAGIKTK